MIFISAIGFALNGVFARILGHDFGVFYQGWVSSAIILVVLLPIAVKGKFLKPIQKPHRKWFSITIFFSVISQAPLYLAFNYLTLGTATFIFFGTFLVTSHAISWLFLGEKITKIKIASLIISLVGVFLTFSLSLTIFSLGAMLLAALSGIASGGEIATSKKSTDSYSSIQLSTYSWIFILVTHLPLSFITNEHQLIPSMSVEWYAMLGYALSALIAFWLVIEGFKYVDASVGSLIGLLEIVFAAAFGMFFFRDQLSTGVIIGGIVILIAAILPDAYALKTAKEKSTLPPPSA